MRVDYTTRVGEAAALLGALRWEVGYEPPSQLRQAIARSLPFHRETRRSRRPCTRRAIPHLFERHGLVRCLPIATILSVTVHAAASAHCHGQPLRRCSSSSTSLVD